MGTSVSDSIIAAGQKIDKSDNSSTSSTTPILAPWSERSEDSRYLPDHGQVLNNLLWNGHYYPMYPQAAYDLTDSSLKSPVQKMPISNLELSSMRMPADCMQPSHMAYPPETIHAPKLTAGSMNDENIIGKRDHGRIEGGDGQSTSLPIPELVSPELGSTEVTAMNYSLLGNHSETQLPVASSSLARPAAMTSRENSIQVSSLPGLATSPSATTDDMEDAPSIDATIEKRFEYLLACARRVGFDGFDALASHYYTLDFDHSSELALEQRMSRHRHLPSILAELRQRSQKWTPWERRGYQEEILKSAEEIYAMECSDFKKCKQLVQVASVTEMTLQDNVSVSSLSLSSCLWGRWLVSYTRRKFPNALMNGM